MSKRGVRMNDKGQPTPFESEDIRLVLTNNTQ
jgi:hypothetical protein